MKICTVKIDLVKVVKKPRKVIIGTGRAVRVVSGLKKLTNNYLYDHVEDEVYGLP